MTRSVSRPLLALTVLVLVSAVAASVYLLRRGPSLPAQGSPEYEQVSRAFYRGLAALDVGLLDDARTSLTRATELVPGEPASWANLGLTLLRLGELDAAAAPVARAMELAPRDAQVVFLAARAAIARGRLDDGLALLRRAVQLDPRGLRARFALGEQIDQISGGEARRERLALLDELLPLAPDNLAILVERAYVASREDSERLDDTLARLASRASSWPPAAREQFEAVREARQRNSGDDITRALVRLRNALSADPQFREDLAAVRTPPELIAPPFDRFLSMTPPSATPAPPDGALSFSREPAGSAVGLTRIAVAPLTIEALPSVIERDATPVDWNHDFRMDLLVREGGSIRLFQQDETGAMADATPVAATQTPAPSGIADAWAADIEMDGDVDLVLGMTSGPTVVLRNNGDGTWASLDTFAMVNGARGFAWADIDGDGDPDAVFVDAARNVQVFVNRQAGAFVPLAVPATLADIVAVTVADLDADGALDLVTLAGSGRITTASRRRDQWTEHDIAEWTGFDPVGAFRLFAADLDNNGALDVIASGPADTRVWLADAQLHFAPLVARVDAPVFGVADLDGDGRLDLAAVRDGRAERLLGRGDKAYHWKTIRAQAQQRAGDQRINSFGIGGEAEVRSGLLVQKQAMTGLPLHFGLGEHAAIDVVRIVWPNGVPQAEFDANVDDAVVAQQRLKGSCPWVFAWNGRDMTFVTDFLWRSPLGLRINAQDTAGVTQTEDWVRIDGDMLAPRGQSYDVRVTAELWETHFFDHVSLMTVDHPDGTEVFVDERFSPTRPQVHEVRTVRMLGPVEDAHDERGRDVTATVAVPDGQYVSGFERGTYQGVAREHFVEFAVDPALPRTGLTLIAQGWVYPTDSSINVAIGQRRDAAPRGVSLEAADASGRWHVVDPDLGFPAGKNKTLVIDLAAAAGASRLRLRTNLEVYWDALRFAARDAAPARTERLAATRAELRYRGFSLTSSPRGDAPETPRYAPLASTAPRWRDLEGYYTRFGDVRELLAGVDDRYVIMNAGDEMRLEFPVPEAPATGWRRDFVLIGDGWEKDGDYNTGYSSTVVPLPTHASAVYRAENAMPDLANDPVYLAHRDDWRTFHTRYVDARPFLSGLRGTR